MQTKCWNWVIDTALDLHGFLLVSDVIFKQLGLSLWSHCSLCLVVSYHSFSHAHIFQVLEV